MRTNWLNTPKENPHEYSLWNNIKFRAKRCGYGISELFLNFDEWLAWSRKQKGFMELDLSGHIFQTESDLLSNGLKRYSEDTVVYVPNPVNQLCKPSSSKGGVQYQEGKSKPYRAYINKFGKSIGLGYFNCEYDARCVVYKERLIFINELEELYYDRVDERVWGELRNDRWMPKI